MASWLEGVLAGLQNGGASAPFAAAPSPFPDIPAPPDEAALAAAAREAAGAKLIQANQRRINPFGMPDASSAGVQLAMGQGPEGTGVPVQGSPQFSPFAIPPSMQLASQMAAPPPETSPDAPPVPGALPPPGSVPMPQPRPVPAPVVAQDDEGPDGGNLPQKAAAAVGAGSPGGPVSIQPPAAVPEPTFGQRSSTIASALAPALLGVGAALQGDGGAMASKLADKREALQTQAIQNNATARLLQSKGAGMPEIMAAIAGGPETMKALLGQYLGKDKFSVTQTGEIEDQYGGKRKIFKIFNSNDGTFKDVPADTAAEAKAIAGDGGAPDLNESQANRVKAIIDGREPYPAQSRAPDAAKIRAGVHAADPNFDAVNYKSREQTRLKFTKGKGADNLSAFNTAIGHLGSLDKSIDELNNSGFPAWNKYVANPVAEQFDSKYQKGLKDFQTARTAVADELTRAFRGSGGNVHDIIQWEKAINAADSPVALKAAVRAAAELLGSRISAVGDEYNRGMGTTKDPLELLNPKAAEAFKRLQENDRPLRAAPAATGKTSTGISWSVH